MSESTPSTAWAATWRQTGSLLALRELTVLSRLVAPVVARRAGLGHHEMVAMEHLMEQPLGPSELAHRLGVTSAAASGIIDRLVARGYVERRADERDRRRTQVHVTDLGRRDMLAHLMPMLTSLAELDRSLSDEEREVVTAYLEGANQALRRLL
jgi:DNA-binding MarR family transcriptional regulator